MSQPHFNGLLTTVIMLKSRTTLLLLLPITLLVLKAEAQFVEERSDSLLIIEPPREVMMKYLNISIGYNAIRFRDFATSPLMYSGLGQTVSLSHRKANRSREREWGIALSNGNASNIFNEHNATSALRRVDFNYSRLYRINALSATKFNTKIGGLFNVMANTRVNPSLQNNALGLEIIPTLFASVKSEKDISRKAEKAGKFLFIKYRLKEVKRAISLRTNVGIVNSSYRNGYAYIGQSQIVNDAKLFDGYEFRIFSGFRIGTTLDFTKYLRNNNAVQFSYVWDALKTGSSFEKFEMSSHLFRVTLMFNTNGK